MAKETTQKPHPNPGAESVRNAVVNALKPLKAQARLADIALSDGRARVILQSGADARADAAAERAVEEALNNLPGIDAVQVITTDHRSPAEAPASTAPKGVRVQGTPQGQGKPRGGARRTVSAIDPPGVRAIIAVASGKGGVGKSTVAVHLALALAALGQRVGLLDADIYGPSIPTMLGITDSPETGPDKKLKPVMAHGLAVMSIGLLVDPDTPMVWRGPMVMSALSQMLSDVDWGERDIMVVDMPPGTGDAQLTMAQRVSLAGAVIVSTPQEIALVDARKAIAMFERTEVPILGMVENMAFFTPPGGADPLYLFGEGGARRTAEATGTRFLGEIPLFPELREGSDAGQPAVSTDPQGRAAQAFQAIAGGVLDALAGAHRPAPIIRIED